MVRVDRSGASSRAGRAGAARRAPSRQPADGQEPGGGIPSALLRLVEQIDSSGSELKRDPTGRSLERYKSSVRSFLDAAVADGMRLSSESSMGLTRRVFSCIARVDVALADLADAVLGRQQDVVRLSQLVDQIKGLIVDLYR